MSSWIPRHLRHLYLFNESGRENRSEWVGGFVGLVLQERTRRVPRPASVMWVERWRIRVDTGDISFTRTDYMKRCIFRNV